MNERPSVGFVGAGRLAAALAPLLVKSAYRVAGVHTRDPRHGRPLARRIPGARVYRDPAKLAAASDVVLLAVPDGAIAEVAATLAACGAPWRGKVALHHAGALGPGILAPLTRRGAACGVLHPLQVMTSAAVLARVLPGTRARIEGSAAATRVARRMARDLGLEPLKLRRLDRAARTTYHTAASLTANDAAALLGEAARLLSGLGVDRREAVRALAALLRGVVEHAAAGDLGQALTGPVPRGDAETLRAHLELLRRRAPHAESAHRALGHSLVSLVEEHGASLTPEQRRRLQEVLDT